MARFTKTHPFVAALLLVVACGLIASHSRAALSTTDSQKAPIHQLRIYEIFEGNKQAFHERFRDHAARIMARYNFKIVAIWESRTNDRTEFVYLLECQTSAPCATAGRRSWRTRSGPT